MYCVSTKFRHMLENIFDNLFSYDVYLVPNCGIYKCYKIYTEKWMDTKIYKSLMHNFWYESESVANKTIMGHVQLWLMTVAYCTSMLSVNYLMRSHLRALIPTFEKHVHVNVCMLLWYPDYTASTHCTLNLIIV